MKDFIPFVSIAPNYITTYELCENKKSPRQDLSGLSIRHHDGFISETAAKRLKLAMDWLFYMTFNKMNVNWKKSFRKQFRLVFCTLTLPSKQIHSDNEIKSKCLNQFLIEARKKFNIDHYIWRAEKQLNGNIHFHIVTDKFMHHAEIRKMWNRIVNKLHYVTNYQISQNEKFKNGIHRRNYKSNAEFNLALSRYNKGKATNWSNPNSTDIHSIQKIQDLRAYIAKYMSKNEGETKKDEKSKIQGRIWFISEKLSKIKKAKEVVGSKISAELNHLFDVIPEKIKKLEHCTVFSIDTCKLLQLGCKELYRIFSDYFIKWQTELYP